MGRTPCCEKNGALRKGPWTTEEDQKLIDYIHKNGPRNWRTLPNNAGLQRCGKSCRLRWTNYLKPDIKRGKFSSEEEETIIQLHSVLGNKWSTIAARLPGRTDNEIKNFWNTHIRKRLLRMGIDPITHTPRLDILAFSSMVNPELLRIASSLLSSQCNQDPNFVHLNTQKNQENTLQVQENHHLVQDQFPSSVSDFKPQTCGYIDILTCNNLENFVTLYNNYDCLIDPRSNVDNKFGLTSNFLNPSTASSSSTLMNLNP